MSISSEESRKEKEEAWGRGKKENGGKRRKREEKRRRQGALQLGNEDRKSEGSPGHGALWPGAERARAAPTRKGQGELKGEESAQHFGVVGNRENLLCREVTRST